MISVASHGMINFLYWWTIETNRNCQVLANVRLSGLSDFVDQMSAVCCILLSGPLFDHYYSPQSSDLGVL